jgi:hypothetical protein
MLNLSELHQVFDKRKLKDKEREDLPCCLSKVWALAGRLKVEPLLDLVLFRLGLVCQPSFRVILVDEVVVNGGRLPKRHPGVRVTDGYISHASALVNMSRDRHHDIKYADRWVGRSTHQEPCHWD